MSILLKLVLALYLTKWINTIPFCNIAGGIVLSVVYPVILIRLLLDCQWTPRYANYGVGLAISLSSIGLIKPILLLRNQLSDSILYYVLLCWIE